MAKQQQNATPPKTTKPDDDTKPTGEGDTKPPVEGSEPKTDATTATGSTPETKTEGEGSKPPEAPPAAPPKPTKKVEVPSLARIVHYVLPEQSNNAGQHRAAVVTSEAGELDAINLSVHLDKPDDAPSDHGFSDRYRLMTQFDMRVFNAPHDADGKPGTWHWPERV